MPSLVVTAHTTAVEVAAERLDAVHRPTSLTINNGVVADRTIRIQDIFTAAVSNGVAVPGAQAIERLRVTVLNGDVLTLSEQDLKGIKCLGALRIIADAIDGTCYITTGYETE